MQGEAEPHPFPATRATDVTGTPRQTHSPAGCPARGCTDPALPLHGNAPRSPRGRCGPGWAPVCRADVAQPQVRSPGLSRSLHLLLRFAFARLAPSLPSPLARAHTTGSQSAPPRTVVGRQGGRRVGGQMPPAGQSFPKAAQHGVLRSCPASSRGHLTGRQAAPAEESIAFPSSAVKPERNFPGCHSSSSGEAYYW